MVSAEQTYSLDLQPYLKIRLLNLLRWQTRFKHFHGENDFVSHYWKRAAWRQLLGVIVHIRDLASKCCLKRLLCYACFRLFNENLQKFVVFRERQPYYHPISIERWCQLAKIYNFLKKAHWEQRLFEKSSRFLYPVEKRWIESGLAKMYHSQELKYRFDPMKKTTVIGMNFDNLDRCHRGESLSYWY